MASTRTATTPRGDQTRPPPSGGGILTVDIDGSADRWWLSLRGELDLASAPMLEHVLLECEARDDRPITLDLRKLAFLDLTGLRVLLAASNRSRTNHLTLIRGPRPVQRVVELTNTEALLPFQRLGIDRRERTDLGYQARDADLSRRDVGVTARASS